MKLLSSSLGALLFSMTITMAMTSQAHAGGINCVLTKPSDNSTITMFMDWEPNGTTLKFNKPVSWSQDLLEFNIIYSNLIGDTHLIAATGTATSGIYKKEQLVEIHFDQTKGDMKNGILRAGDRNIHFGNLAKYQEYTIVCD